MRRCHAPEPGAHAVDDVAVGHNILDHFARRVDPRMSRGRHFNPRLAERHLRDFGKRQGAAGQLHARHLINKFTKWKSG